MQVRHFFVYNILKLLTYHTLFTGNHSWVINAQTGLVFWSTLCICSSTGNDSSRFGL